MKQKNYSYETKKTILMKKRFFFLVNFLNENGYDF